MEKSDVKQTGVGWTAFYPCVILVEHDHVVYVTCRALPSFLFFLFDNHAGMNQWASGLYLPSLRQRQ